jgi:phosphatidylserine decarboxylase
MRIPLAREGLPFILGTAAPAVVALCAALLWRGAVLWGLALSLALLALGMLAFFRDPERSGPRGTDLIIAPADGTIVDLSPAEEPSYLKSEASRVSIFLSLFDVHINRYPVSGRVEHRAYDAGRFEPAWRAAASHSNERSSTGIEFRGRAVLVRQIAGVAARRITTYARIGDDVIQGQRMGLIRFGSRVDVYMPGDASLEVKVGQRARGGVTVLARLPRPAEEQ